MCPKHYKAWQAWKDAKWAARMKRERKEAERIRDLMDEWDEEERMKELEAASGTAESERYNPLTDTRRDSPYTRREQNSCFVL